MDRQLSSIFLSFLGIALLLLPLWRPTFHASIFLITLVLGIFLVHRLVRTAGRAVVGAIIVGIVVLQAQWGLAQFVWQRDLGMYLASESRLSADRAGVAKFEFGEGKIIRAYGPYPHANSLAGVLVIAWVLLPQLIRWQRGEDRVLGVPWLALALVIILGMLVTFSRSAWLGAMIGLVVGWRDLARIRGLMVVVTICVLVFIPLLSARLTDAEDRGVSDRVSQWDLWRSVMKQHSAWSGVGLGKYPAVSEAWMREHNLFYQPWEVAPVHSVPLLLAAEWGWVGAGALALLWLAAAWRSHWAWLGLVPPLLFDHYFVTQIGPLAFLVVLSAVWSVSKRRPQSQA